VRGWVRPELAHLEVHSSLPATDKLRVSLRRVGGSEASSLRNCAHTSSFIGTYAFLRTIYLSKPISAMFREITVGVTLLTRYSDRVALGRHRWRDSSCASSIHRFLSVLPLFGMFVRGFGRTEQTRIQAMPRSWLTPDQPFAGREFHLGCPGAPDGTGGYRRVATTLRAGFSIR